MDQAFKQGVLEVLRSSSLSLLVRQLQGAVLDGIGSPEGVVAAPIGVLYRRLDGGAGSTLYVKEAGADEFGWVAK